MPFMMRNAEDDFDALLMADAMECTGAVVVAITTRGRSTHQGALADHVQLTVWARVSSTDMISRIDHAIEVTLEKRWAGRGDKE